METIAPVYKRKKVYIISCCSLALFYFPVVDYSFQYAKPIHVLLALENLMCVYVSMYKMGNEYCNGETLC